jgi:hypothetical protein
MVLALVAGLLASATRERATRAAEESSLTLYTVECSEPFALDGTPITAEVCDTTVDRTFTLVGPSGQEVELSSRLELALDAPRARVARWSVDAEDVLDDTGTYMLTESSDDPDRQTLFECLLTTDDGLVPADLAYVDGGVEFEWTPADVASEEADGETLVCRAYSIPTEEDDAPMPGIVQIRAGVASSEGESDLIVRDPEAEPYDLAPDGDATPVPSLGYTLTDADFDELTLTTSRGDDEPSVTSFPVEPGTYTLTTDATDTSVEVSVESGQTVLVFNPIGQPSGDGADESLDLELNEFTPTPSVEFTPAPPVELTPTPSVQDPPQVAATENFAFSAADWSGAYANVDAGVYGRQCVAIYGAGSPNPAGSLTFELDRVTAGNSQLVLTGLDDELTSRNPMVVTVNGAVVFNGPNPFFDWDPNNPVVAWSQITIPFANDLLVAGANQIVVANATPGGSIGLRPTSCWPRRPCSSG